jgi:hypothetical protein
MLLRFKDVRNMKVKVLSIFLVVAFALGACGEGTTSSSTAAAAAAAVAGVSVPSRVEIIPDD